MNVVSLVGVVGRDPDLSYTRGGTPACVVILGVDRPGKRDTTDWIRCQSYGKTAEWLAKWMHKGDRLGLTGALCCDQWTNRDGQKQHMWYILIDRAEFVERKRDSGADPAAVRAYQAAGGVAYEDLETGEDVNPDDLPF